MKVIKTKISSNVEDECISCTKVMKVIKTKISSNVEDEMYKLYKSNENICIVDFGIICTL